MNLDFLSRVRMVMVNTSHPGNIGAAARVMKNMGLSQLYLVEPVIFPDGKATAMAAGADDILENAVQTETLEQALKGCQIVYATTARMRKLKHRVLLPDQAVTEAAQLQAKGDIAFVFGRERTGLTNHEISLCETLINIPTVADYSSLNVASAIQIIAYEIYRYHVQPDLPIVPSSDNLATHDELENFFQHLQDSMVTSGFLDVQKSPQIMPKLRHFFHRSQLQQSEVNILRGFLSAINKQ